MADNQAPPQPSEEEVKQKKEQARKMQVEQYKSRHNELSNMLNGYTETLKQALPRFLTPEKMIRVVLTAISRTPDIMACTNISIISCVVTCCQLGLMPDAIIGEAYLIPFNNNKKGTKECTVIIGYKGLCALAFRSGQVKSIQARAVFEGDEFEYELGLNEKLKHVPSGESDQKKITHFYAVVHLVTGGHVFNVMTRKQVEGVRNESKAYASAFKKEDTIWVKHFEDMGAKTVLRRLMKFVPLSPEVQKAIGLDEAADYGKQGHATDHMDLLGDMQYTEDAIAEVLDNVENTSQDDKDAKAEDLKARADAATQATLNLAKDDKKNGKK